MFTLVRFLSHEPARSMIGPRIFTPEYHERMRRLEASGWWNAGMRDTTRKLLAGTVRSGSGLALDVGCGSGQTMQWFRTLYPGWRIHGFDLARDALRAAVHGNVGPVAAASALAIPWPKGSVDVVITLDVLQHLPLGGGDLSALRETRRVLRAGGHLLIRTNAQAFPRTVDDPVYNFRKYRPEELRARLESAGFRVHRLSRINALLGLGEIPRELRARRQEGSGYHGILTPGRPATGWFGDLKRRWLRFEGSLVATGWRLPFGRTLLALGVAQ